MLFLHALCTCWPKLWTPQFIIYRISSPGQSRDSCSVLFGVVPNKWNVFYLPRTTAKNDILQFIAWHLHQLFCGKRRTYLTSNCTCEWNLRCFEAQKLQKFTIIRNHHSEIYNYLENGHLPVPLITTPIEVFHWIIYQVILSGHSDHWPIR